MATSKGASLYVGILGAARHYLQSRRAQSPWVEASLAGASRVPWPAIWAWLARVSGRALLLLDTGLRRLGRLVHHAPARGRRAVVDLHQLAGGHGALAGSRWFGELWPGWSRDLRSRLGPTLAAGGTTAAVAVRLGGGLLRAAWRETSWVVVAWLALAGRIALLVSLILVCLIVILAHLAFRLFHHLYARARRLAVTYWPSIRSGLLVAGNVALFGITLFLALSLVLLLAILAGSGALASGALLQGRRAAMAGSRRLAELWPGWSQEVRTRSVRTLSAAGALAGAALGATGRLVYTVWTETSWVLAAFAWCALAGGLLALEGVSGVAIAGYTYDYVRRDLPAVAAIDEKSPPLSVQILDRNGQLLYELFDSQLGARIWVPLAEMPLNIQQATIATEDATFYENPGFSFRGMLRAAIWNLTNPEGRLQGGSSITQQLVKNVLIPPEERHRPSFVRKIKEMLLASEVTRRYSKDDILERYLNLVFYGNLSYGIEAAAQGHFGKPARELSLAEAALLAGLPQAPALYSPFVNPEGAKRQQELVLERMVDRGFISPEEMAAAQAEELHYSPRRLDIKAPHFVMHVRDLLEERYGRRLFSEGLKVTTSLDLGLQEEGERIVREHVERIGAYGASNASLVALQPATGEILALVGSADYFNEAIQGQINMALAPRQPGSAFKPLTYLTAFLKGFTPATMLVDARTTFPDGANPPYVPESVDGRYRGRVSAREALASSLNVPAVRAIQYAGVHEVIDVAHRMGITDLNRENWYGLSLTLGGGEVKLLDLAFAYGVLANNGLMAGVPVQGPRLESLRALDPVAILKVETKRGKVAEEFEGPATQQVVPAPHAYLITNILSDARARLLLFAPNSPLFLADQRPAAVKTGTTDDWRDTWTIGYTPDLVVGVWVGNADNAPMRPTLSVLTAAPIWKEFMEAALAGTPPSAFEMPPGVVEATICTTSGLLANGRCPSRQELFVEGTQPQQQELVPHGVPNGVQPVANRSEPAREPEKDRKKKKR
ncbi:MAG: transglycosylase domain-containing protein [Chloroflexi bacterium]|nr:transglycosylase domain-containing protein [Chloroflexota bacterium]